MMAAVGGKVGPLPLLTGYDAKRCQRRIHNDHDATLEKVPWEVPADLQKRFDEGDAFEAAVFAVLKEQLPETRWIDLSGVSGKRANIEATVSAMDSGVDLILGGWLPDDPEGGRTGRPDLLLRIAGGYVPGDVKWHKTVRSLPSGKLRYSLPASPEAVEAVEGLTARTTDRIDDYLQLSHYWRMLQASGFVARGSARGFLIGTDRVRYPDLYTHGLVLTWLDLEAPAFTTFSRSRGKAKRTALERYDFEHAIRIDIARVAESRTGGPDDPEPLVRPIFSAECDACPWHDYCHALDSDAASAHVDVGRLDVREWRALDALGIRTLDDLAEASLDDAFLASYLPEVTHHGSAATTRLATGRNQSRL